MIFSLPLSLSGNRSSFSNSYISFPKKDGNNFKDLISKSKTAVRKMNPNSSFFQFIWKNLENYKKFYIYFIMRARYNRIETEINMEGTA